MSPPTGQVAVADSCRIHPASPAGRSAPWLDAIIPMGDGTRLAAEVWRARTQSRRAVVFVHGFCGNKAENGLFRRLAADCSANGLHAVLYDWRGIAPSPGEFGATTLRDHVADFQQVVTWTRSYFRDSLDCLSAIGFSLGAAVIGSALRDRTELSSVAYLSPAVRPNLSMWPRYNTRPMRWELKHRGVVEKPGSSVLLGRPIIESLRDTDLGPRAFNFNLPLLVCHGTNDERIDCSSTRKLVARARASRLEYTEFEGASHSFRPADRWWAELSSVLTSWLATQRGA